MKKIFLDKIVIIVFALFSIMLLQKVVSVKGKETQRALATRDEWQKPDEVVKSINLKPGDVIADIGAGNGYFTKRFANAVNPGGQALGLDIVPSKVEYMRKDAEKLGLNNYKALLIKSDDSQLEPGSVDVVFLCNAYHHLENRVDYLKRLSRSLKKNGRVVIVDFYKKPLPVVPSAVDHKLSKEVVLEEFQAAGYKLQHDKDFLPYQYYLEFGL
jgi:ubiquinone/menaquinone biosynthesis C-methylase UbiE